MIFESFSFPGVPQGDPCIGFLMILIKKSMKNPCHVGMDFSSIKKKKAKKKIARNFPLAMGGVKYENFITVPGTRGHGPGTSRVSYRSDPTQIDPNPGDSVAQIRPRWPEMLRSRFWLQKKDLGASFGAIGMVFRDLSGRSRPDSKKLKI